MIFVVKDGARIASTMPLTPVQREQTPAEYEASRCMRCGTPTPSDDTNHVKLYATPEGPVCSLCDLNNEGGTMKFSYRVDAPGNKQHDEEAIVIAKCRDDADARATELAVEWSVDLKFVGVRVPGKGLEIQVPLEQLPESWRDEVAA